MVSGDARDEAEKLVVGIVTEFGGDAAKLRDDCADGLVQGRCPCGDADVSDTSKPIRLEVRCFVDLNGGASERACFFGKLAGVVAVLTADDHDHFVLAAELIESCLSLFGWMTDGVDESNFDFWTTAFEGVDQLQRHLEWQSGLGDNANLRGIRDVAEIGLGEDNGGLREISGEAPDLGMLGLTDDDGAVSF